ncbi:hypothetical protein ACFU5O_29965 [Streptomyces sp. NPDC057445]|uniref:hypothetical protein n=1 Tax=Streptomyces sp. NPDC057445 TaxID=3346136 RepID=UPI00367D0FE2
MISSGNAALAAVLDRRSPEEEETQLLGAIADAGVYVPVDERGSVVFLGDGGDGGPVLPGYVSEQCCRERLPQAAAAVHTDVLRLLDIGAKTGVARLAVFSPGGWATVPLPLLTRTLQERGMRTQEDRTVRLTWSTHPAAVALRDAVRDRLRDFPGIQTVWIAHACWSDTGAEHLMLHIALTPGDPADQPSRLMETILSDHVTLTATDPQVAVRVLDPVADRAAAAELDTLGLDTVRADHATGRVVVVSREYDGR